MITGRFSERGQGGGVRQTSTEYVLDMKKGMVVLNGRSGEGGGVYRVQQIFLSKLVLGQVACKKHLPSRMSWLSNITSEKAYRLEFMEFYFRE